MPNKIFLELAKLCRPKKMLIALIEQYNILLDLIINYIGIIIIVT